MSMGRVVRAFILESVLYKLSYIAEFVMHNFFFFFFFFLFLSKGLVGFCMKIMVMY